MRHVGVAVAVAIVSIPAAARAECHLRFEATTGAGGWGFIGDSHGGADGMGLELALLYAPRCGIAVIGARSLLLFGMDIDLFEVEGEEAPPQKSAVDLAPVAGLSFSIWRIGLMATAGPALTSLRPDRHGPSTRTIGAALDAGVRFRLYPNFWLGARVAENINEVQTAQAWFLELAAIMDL